MTDGASEFQRLQDEVEALREKVADLESRLATARGAAGRIESDMAAPERERLIEIIESTTDGVAISLPAQGILYMNWAARQMLGLSPDEAVVGKQIEEFHPPHATQKVLNVGIPAAIEHGSYSHETYLRHRDGTEIPISQVILSHKRPDGEVEFMSTIFRDITDRIRAQRALAESEEKFRTIIQASPMGVHMYELKADGQLVFTGANPAADELLGVDNSQFIGKTIEDAFPSSKDTDIPRRYRLAASEGTPWRVSQVNYADQRVAGAFEVHAFQTSPNRMAAMFLDITNRLQAEEALRESEERYRELFETMAQGVVYQDADGRIIMANPAAERILGLGAEEMTGRTSTDSRWQAVRDDGSEFPGDEHPSMESLRTGEATQAVMGIFNPAEGRRHWIDVHATPQFRPGESRPYQVFSTFTDITERRLGDLRRAELEVQLRQAQKMEAIGQLAGGIAHDFNNLLTTIAGYSEMLWEDAQLDAQSRSDLEEIRKAADRAAALTEQLLAFSRKQIISPRVLDLNARIRETHNLLRRLIGETIELELNLSEAPCQVEADPNQIDQILINLAVNARDAMPGGGRLSISTARVTLDQTACRTELELEPGEFIALSVGDTGQGMTPDTLGRAFEPFFTTKPYGKGTGLGLSTVYGIVKQNNGAVKMRSRPQEGTRVEIFLPFAETKKEREARETGPADVTGSETILLVEDEDAVRSLTEKVLRSRGYNVLLAGTPEEAVRTCREHDGMIDLLLTDVVMPQMNGRELYRRLREIRPGLRSLYMSGYAADVIARHGVLEGDTAFIPKPFTTRALAEKVREALDKEV